VAGDEGIVSFGVWETRCTERICQDAISSAVIENAPGFGAWKQTAEPGGVSPWTCLEIVRIDQRILFVVDEPLKILGREMIECGCEYELARLATVVIDGHARDIEDLTPVDFAVLMEVDDSVNESQCTTAFAW
jgi:hypothetical protein